MVTERAPGSGNKNNRGLLMMMKVPLGYSQPDRKQLVVTDSFFGDLDKRGPALSEYFPNLSTLFWTGIKVLGFSDRFHSLEGLSTIITLMLTI